MKTRCKRKSTPVELPQPKGSRDLSDAVGDDVGVLLRPMLFGDHLVHVAALACHVGVAQGVFVVGLQLHAHGCGIAGLGERKAMSSRVWVDIADQPYATCWTRRCISAGRNSSGM